MYTSTFEIFKLGVGPSSSHTVGPMVAASLFRNLLAEYPNAVSVRATLHGSLAFTGKGHRTDWAIKLGLLGFKPDTLDQELANAALNQLKIDKSIRISQDHLVSFDEVKGVCFDFDQPLPGHPNGLQLAAYDELGEEILTETYYSVGGGIVKTAKELATSDEADFSQPIRLPYQFSKAKQLLSIGHATQLEIWELANANELSLFPGRDIKADLMEIWFCMESCIARGLSSEGELPGGLNVQRRAKSLLSKLENPSPNLKVYPDVKNDWLSVYAMAVNEENAAGGKVVTAPTNGAAGVIPAVIKYHLQHCRGNEEDITKFLLTASVIGGLIKLNASISGAECGCQAEVGAASSMAAAGLCAVRGGNNKQVENAAEIALEHHLGLTCDPVNGLVQVPCIERNGVGAVKAVLAASLALNGNGAHIMPLDNCIETMRQTGRDMQSKYKETSKGGLAVNLPEC